MNAHINNFGNNLCMCVGLADKDIFIQYIPVRGSEL